jgi:hypothetical protein
VLELVDYWKDFPPTHVILAARYLDSRRSHRPGKMNEAERKLQVSVPTKSFDTLPLAVQAAIHEANKNG